ncbi:MAG: adenosylmethionine decarboxylase [Candidatus Aenigmatarchaeota archaeon]
MRPTGHHIIAEFIYCSKDVLNSKEKIEKILSDGITNAGLSVVSIHTHKFNPAGITCLAIISESHIAIHTYPEARHASVDIFTCSPGPEKPFMLLNYLKKQLKPKTLRVGHVCRGNPLEIKYADWMEGFSTVGFEVRYHVKKVVHSSRSKFQQIDIIENDNFGRMLLLDKDVQIAEKDANSYTKNLVMPLVASGNSLQKVMILGGGDGAAAAELMQNGAKKIAIVDIDKEVIAVSKKYLRKINRNVFKNPKVKVTIGDAYRVVASSRKYDAVIYDLTIHPEAFIKIDREAYLSKLFMRIKKSLNSGGMVTVQCGTEFDYETFRMIKRILKKHFIDVNFSSSFIPSYCANWIFASAKKK